MTFREDFFRMLDGKTPVSDIPYYSLDMAPASEPGGMALIMPDCFGMAAMAATGKNLWGVPYKIDEFGTGFMPAPGEFILKDVTKWRDVVKAPLDDSYDWALAAERDLAMQKWNPETQVSASFFALVGGFFISLSSFLGFENTMLSMYDEPEAVHELLDYLCDYDIWLLDNFLDNYKGIDIIGMGDDNATEINPFISYDMFKEFLLPRYKRVADKIKEHDKIVLYHNCGRCEDFMDDFVDIGVQVWNCATDRNDLNAFKAKHGNKIILEYTPRVFPDAPEEVTRQQVRDDIDKFAAGGAFIWLVNSMTNNPEIGGNLSRWITDEVSTYGKGYYA